MTEDVVSSAQKRRRNLWEIAIVVLGLNLWVTFLLVPLLHLDSPPETTVVLCLVPLLALAAGVFFRQRVVLLGGYPLLLAVPTLVSPKLVGVNVYSPLTFCLVSISFVAYSVATVALLQAIQAPPGEPDGKSLGKVRLDERWRRRVRIHRWMAVLAGLFPALLIFAVFLHPGIQQDLAAYYPRRGTAPQVFSGVLVLALWVVIFHAYFLTPLRSHIRGDPHLRYELRRLRSEARLGKPRPGFYVYVLMALVFMVLLVAGRGC